MTLKICCVFAGISNAISDISDEGLPGYCRPACSPDFCRKHPRSICSARDVAEKKQPCQGSCQHTSCTACTFITEPDCVKCRKDDFRCLKKFGKCVKRDTCSRKKFPCKWKRLKEPERGTFQCKVPGCRG